MYVNGDHAPAATLGDDVATDGTRDLRATGRDHGRAVGDLFRRHGAMVYARASRLLGRHDDAEAAMHEVFLRVLGAPDRVDGRGELTTRLYRITTDHCLALLRADRREPLDEARGGEADDLAPLRRLLGDADEEQARAVIYVHLDGMSQVEAARLMGVSQRTVDNLVDRFMRWAEGRAAGGAAR